MALSKKSITGLGTFLSCAVIAVSGFLVVKPSYDQSQNNLQELSTMQVETETKTIRLGVLEEGVENYDEIQAYVDTFLTYAPAYKDIESASRAISESLISGVSITSFNFGAEEAATEYPVPEASLENTEGSAPSNTGDSASAEGADGAAAASGTFQRVPVEVSVTATNYDALSNYLDNLSQQDRLIVVMSVNSSGNGENITATIKGYAFIYSR